jgi:hypothetical protein
MYKLRQLQSCFSDIVIIYIHLITTKNLKNLSQLNKHRLTCNDFKQALPKTMTKTTWVPSDQVWAKKIGIKIAQLRGAHTNSIDR